MADEETAKTPEGTIDAPTTTQPQADPAAPQGMTEQDKQAGTTADDGGKAQREELYQTKYQKMKESRDRLQDELEVYRATYGDPANQQPPQGQQQYGSQPATQETGQSDEDYDFNPYDRRQMQTLIKTTMGGELRGVLTEFQQQQRQEAEAREVHKRFVGWVRENKVPDDLVNEAVREYASRWSLPNGGLAGAPSVIVDWVTDYIVRKSDMERGNQTIDQRAREAAEKAKQLAGVENPQPGQPPNPSAPEQKSWQDALRDEIAPSDSEPSYD